MKDKVSSLRGFAARSRHREVRPGEWAAERYLVDAAARAVSNGRFLYCTTGILTPALGASIRGLLSNPANSSRVLVVVALLSDIGGEGLAEGSIFKNPDTNLPTTTRFVWQPNDAVTDFPVTEFFADTGATMTGGTDVARVGLPGPGRVITELPGGIPVLPGTSIGINVPTGVLTSADANFGAYVIEEDFG